MQKFHDEQKSNSFSKVVSKRDMIGRCSGNGHGGQIRAVLKFWR